MRIKPVHSSAFTLIEVVISASPWPSFWSADVRLSAAFSSQNGSRAPATVQNARVGLAPWPRIPLRLPT
jgi:hypothetical protein